MTQKTLTFNEKIEMLEALKKVHKNLEYEMHYCMVCVNSDTDEYRSYTEEDGSYWKDYKRQEDIYRALLEVVEDMI